MYFRQDDFIQDEVVLIKKIYVWEQSCGQDMIYHEDTAHFKNCT